MKRDLKGYETHHLLEKRYFPWKPWLLRIFIMILSFSALGYVKFKMFEKNQAAKRPNVTVPASRSKD